MMVITNTIEEPGMTVPASAKPKRKNRPGQGRKPKANTYYKEGIESYLKAFPTIAKEIVNKAMPQTVSFKCKHCRRMNQLVAVPGTGDKDCLIHVDNRVQGKPSQVSTIELQNKSMQLDNTQLSRLYQEVIVFGEEFKAINFNVVEAQVKLLVSPLDTKQIQSDGSLMGACANQDNVSIPTEPFQENEGGEGVVPLSPSEELLVGKPSDLPENQNEGGICQVEDGSLKSHVGDKKVDSEEKKESQHWMAVEPTDEMDRLEQEIKARAAGIALSPNDLVEVENFG